MHGYIWLTWKSSKEKSLDKYQRSRSENFVSETTEYIALVFSILFFPLRASRELINGLSNFTDLIGAASLPLHPLPPKKRKREREKKRWGKKRNLIRKRESE